MKFVTEKELNKDIIDNLYKIPRDVDIIVGIPRSGMLVGSLIALYLNKPLTDIDSFINKKMYSMGYTKNTNNCIDDFSKVKKVLIVDDSTSSGKSILEAKKKLKDIKIELIFYVSYATKATSNMVDIYNKLIECPRIFEWNFMHHASLINACVDIDGVLCIDPTNKENDDGVKYRNFILNAKPKYIPTRKIGYIVTSRLEKYRKETEEWLKKNNIKYNKLIMLNLKTAKERQQLGNHARFKANVFLSLNDADYFIESDINQAKEIASITGKEVFCIDDEVYFEEKKFNKIKKAIKKIIKKMIPQKILNKIRKEKDEIKKKRKCN